MLHRLIWNTHTRDLVLWVLAHLLPIRRGRVMCVCWGGNEYGCNPKAITDAVVEKSDIAKQFQIVYAFVHPDRFQAQLPKDVEGVEIGSLRYYWLLSSAQFIIANTHIAAMFFPYKRRGQQYIFTGHGSFGIKKIEFDAQDSLSAEYLAAAEKDVARWDLAVSGSVFRSRVFRSAYRYQGEILEQGTPRNDCYFGPLSTKSDEHYFDPLTAKTDDRHYLIYTPTFRKNGRRDVYGFDVDRVVAALEQRFGGTWYIRISSHPNMRDYYRKIYDFGHPRMVDVGTEDLQPLLLTSDALITDYSSAEMDFILRNVCRKEEHRAYPVFQLCRDRKDYDRGFYIDPETLPFPYAENDDQLVRNILDFDNDQYLAALEMFNTETIGLKETGHAAEAVVEWMLDKMK